MNWFITILTKEGSVFNAKNENWLIPFCQKKCEREREREREEFEPLGKH
jgi:hypothetical protein